MPSKWRMVLADLTHRLWFRAALYCVFGGLTALLGAVAKGLIPEGIAGRIGADSVGNLLGILASSMLAVTTFSLSTMVSSFEAAGNNATPRASDLLIRDSTTQRALAGFIGVFLFAIVGLVALSTGVYGDSGRIILFGATILVILAIVVTLLRWIDKLSRLGRVPETIERVEEATARALDALAHAPFMQGNPWQAPPAAATAVEAGGIGYLQMVDVGALQRLADRNEAQVWVAAMPGEFVAPGTPVAWVAGKLPPELREKIADAFVVGRRRTYDYDPRFGLVVLAEVGQRALSPGVNDPGTAIAVLTAATRLLCQWASARDEARDEPPRCPRVFVRGPDEGDFFDDLFAPLARDGAGSPEVGQRLQKALATLGQLGYPPFVAPAAEQARRALVLAGRALSLDEDRRRLGQLAQWCSGPA